MGKTFKLHDHVFAVKRVAKFVCTITEGTVIACDAPGDVTARVSFYDESGLCDTGLVEDTFLSLEESQKHQAVVLLREWKL